MLGKPFAFIDLETTGTNIVEHEIIEIGCIIVKETSPGVFAVKQEFEIKVKPEHIETADPVALRINGYDEGQWLFAHTKTEAMKMLSEKTEGAILVAHNVAFDSAFLQKAFAESGVPNKMFYASLDTITLAFAKLKNTEEVTSFTLRSMCAHFGIKNEKAHTALADVRATFELFKKLMTL